MLYYILALAQPAAEGKGDPMAAIGGFLPIILMIVIFYFLLIAPQRKKQKRHQAMIANVKKGDRIVTAGGLHAVVTGVKDKTVTIKLGSDTKVELDKSSIAYLQSEEGTAEIEPPSS
ncbi:MAG: preprotein translocase subunit YajC [bacterium]